MTINKDRIEANAAALNYRDVSCHGWSVFADNKAVAEKINKHMGKNRVMVVDRDGVEGVGLYCGDE